MMLNLAVFYDIPQLNLGQLFVEADENEKAAAADQQHKDVIAAVAELKIQNERSVSSNRTLSYQCLTV